MKVQHTPVHFTFDLLSESHFIKAIKHHQGKMALLADKKVASLYGDPIIQLLKEKEIPCPVITFPSGEKQKNRRTKEKIEDALFDHHMGRDTLLIVMGGGVTTDLGGFVAATYCRGIPYLSIPTSLLGMVDASIGGKTGVNVPHGKNLIGAFYPPKALFIDFSFLSTLSDHDIRCGTAEIIKHGLIHNQKLFYSIVENLKEWQQRDLPFFKTLITESCHIKKKVVETDEKEGGLRRTLNFGHTIGHAIEQVENYALSHGEAIAIGMVVEALISHKLGHLREDDVDAIHEVFKQMGFALKLSEKVTIRKLKEAMILDKKSAQGAPRFVVLHAIGKVEPFKGAYCTLLDDILLEEALGWMIAKFA
ncbi:MAG: 3-dehydroquinate synthase [Chlamydiia bacterium]|nr:3-dehydroquinate synthase [Chlamydiia bacterium]